MMLPLPWACIAQDHAENVGLECRGKAFGSLICDQAALTFGACVVDRDVDGLINHVADIIFLADVGVDELGLCTQRAQLLGERLAGLVSPAGDNHFRTLLGEGDRGGAPNAGEATGNQDDLRAHGFLLVQGSNGRG